MCAFISELQSLPAEEDLAVVLVGSHVGAFDSSTLPVICVVGCVCFVSRIHIQSHYWLKLQMGKQQAHPSTWDRDL